MSVKNLNKFRGIIFKNSRCLKVLQIGSVQGIVALGGHFATLCRELDFYEAIFFFIIHFQKEKGNTFTLLIILIVKILQKEQNSTNLLL